MIVLAGWLFESFRLAVAQPAWGRWSPAGWLIAQMWIATKASAATLTNWHKVIWAFHLLTVALLFITLPAGTLMHVVTGPLNVFFSKIDQPAGQLAPIPETAKGEPIYTSTL